MAGGAAQREGLAPEGEGQPRRAHHPEVHGALLLGGGEEGAEAESDGKDLEGVKGWTGWGGVGWEREW